MKYLNLIRWPNVLMTLITQVIILYWFLPESNADLTLALWQQLVIIFSTCCIVAAGNVINDIYDADVDRINKPDQVIVGRLLSIKSSNRLYIGLTFTAVVGGFVVANSIDRAGMASIFIVVSFLLYYYATTLKKQLVIGNVVISLLVGLVMLLTAVVELYPALNDANQSEQGKVLLLLTGFAVLAFFVNLLREWIKDAQDINGDLAGGRSSLPLVLGKQRACRVMAVYTLTLAAVLAYWFTNIFYQLSNTFYYSLFAIIAPLMYIGIRLWNVENDKELKILSLVCKLVLLAGIVLIGLSQ
ncbi:geranylgeranylglycerol-phosphate geranylgeranyltransferase [Nonlabens ponticola]|uniref:Prenyltransferase n=1 Tax=Nonlabens ponticola TaxID=2496866 RepID=A0A3S9MYX4_9FLAO|nr:geranylgeranylglycerol-phosphate geranylgeranyltransferase [Nonlabens ponticola]AZQ44390.1 prenyltransferase [Nonlabens ponticola]